jgi:hypothetical protein
MGKLFLSKGRQIPSTEMIKIWGSYLKEYSHISLVDAFEAEIKSNNDFPTLGRILNHIEPLDSGIKARSIWNGLLNKIRSGDGIYTDSEKSVAKKVAGSIEEIKSADQYSLSFIKKDFIEEVKTVLKKQNYDKIESKFKDVKEIE